MSDLAKKKNVSLGFPKMKIPLVSPLLVEDDQKLVVYET